MKTELSTINNTLEGRNVAALQFNESMVEKIDSICTPLFHHFGMTHFGYIKIYNNGSMLRVANNQQWTRRYFEKGFYNDGSLYNIHTLSKDKSHFLLLTGQPEGEHLSSLCKEFNIWNALAIYEKFDEYIDFWFFGTSRENTEAINFYMNKICVLNKFILYFKDRLFHDLNGIHSDKLIHSNIQILENTNEEKEKIKNFLDSLCIKFYKIDDHVSITKNEFEYLFYLAQGKTSKEIARLTGGSFRTIEFHLDAIKRKAKCQNKAQLIDFIKNNVLFCSLFNNY